MDLHTPSSATKSSREAIHSYFWARNSTENHELSETLVFPLVFVGFLHSPHQETKNLLTSEMRTEREYPYFSPSFVVERKREFQTYLK